MVESLPSQCVHAEFVFIVTQSGTGVENSRRRIQTKWIGHLHQ